MRRQAVAVAIGVVAGVAIVATPPYAASRPAGGSRIVTRVFPVAGSARHLIYVENIVAEHDPHRNRHATFVLYDRLKNGTTGRLGRTLPQISHYAIAGHSLIGIDDADLSNVRAHWWNLKTHTHGITPLRDDGWLRAAAPRGAVIARTNGDLEVLRHNGGERSLGTPFRGDLVESAASSDDGLIVTSTFGEVAYMRWARRGHYRTLDIAAARPPTNPANCSALNASYAGCIADIKRPRLVPLDGNPPTVTKTSEHFDWLAVSGSTLLFVPDPYRARKHHGQLGSIHAGNTHRRFSTFQVGTLSEAYNKGVLTRNHFRRRLYVATNAHHVRKLLTVPRSVK